MHMTDIGIVFFVHMHVKSNLKEFDVVQNLICLLR